VARTPPSSRVIGASEIDQGEITRIVDETRVEERRG